jgi:hypothetical protein
VVEGGLLALAFMLKAFRRRHKPAFVFDLITLMSRLHRDRPGDICGWQCRFRRRVWRILEHICTSVADVSTAGNAKEIEGLSSNGEARVVPHIVPESHSIGQHPEDPNLVGFLGNGTVGPNREAVEFMTSVVLMHPGLKAMRCRVIGDATGYQQERSSSVDFVGTFADPSEPLKDVSVCCAPMRETGGVSTKVLTSLMRGKRTVCTPEAARGIAVPPNGLWVAELPLFAETLIAAVSTEWPPDKAQALADWMSFHHGPRALMTAWKGVVESLTAWNGAALP